MKVTKLKIDGMTCQHCVMHVRNALEAVPTVVNVDVEIGKAVVEHNGASDAELVEAVKSAGDYHGTVV